MINKSGITDTTFSDDQTSVEVTHADVSKATYTDGDLYTICEEILGSGHKKIVTKNDDGSFSTEIYPIM
jgi:hypothetical protein